MAIGFDTSAILALVVLIGAVAFFVTNRLSADLALLFILLAIAVVLR